MIVRVVARLVDSSGDPIVGRTVYFYVSGDGSDWTLIGKAYTDGGGYASVVYSMSGRTWFKAYFKGDEYYEPASAVAVWEPPEECSPLLRVGIDVLDRVVFCVGRYGVTVAVVLAAFFVLLLLVGRRR
jgi:hypothetical protein